MEEFQQHFTFVSIVSLTVCACVCVCAEFTQLSDMLLSFLVVSPAALVYKNLRQNILVKAARKTGSQTRQTIRLAREPIDTHTHMSSVWQCLQGDAHTHREREIVDRKVKTKHKQNSFTFIKFAYKYKTYSRNTYRRMRLCMCVCNCFEGQITKSPTRHPEKHNICSCMYAMCILNGAKVVTKL